MQSQRRAASRLGQAEHTVGREIKERAPEGQVLPQNTMPAAMLLRE